MSKPTRKFEKRAYELLLWEAQGNLSTALFEVAKKCEQQTSVGYQQMPGNVSQQTGVSLSKVLTGDARKRAGEALASLKRAIDAFDEIAAEVKASLPATPKEL